ncbi:MAG TPA: hypothetical protein VIJ25_14615, partial [Methylococcales bacterium]
TDLTTTVGPYLIKETELFPSSGTVNKSILQKTNSPNHQQEGQNVLYGDAHVAFESRPDVGIEQDNIYLPWNADPAAQTVKAAEKQTSTKKPTYGGTTTGPINNPGDSFLVN